MKGGWLEHEIRSLPHVLACSVSPDDVVVLIDPSADPVAVEHSVRGALARAGMDVPVRVFGGERPIFVEPMPIRNGRYALVGSLGGAAILAAGVWLAGATGALRGPKGRTTVVTLAPPPPRKLVLIPMVGGDGASAPLPAQEVTPPPLLRPFRRPVLTGAHHGSSPTRGRGDRSAPSPQQPQQPKEPDEHSLLDGIGATLDRVTDLVGGR